MGSTAMYDLIYELRSTNPFQIKGGLEGVGDDCMIMGADVSHPSPGQGGGSIVSVVASMNSQVKPALLFHIPFANNYARPLSISLGFLFKSLEKRLYWKWPI
jgi:hypothetical protein